jgi:hypothetical protein
MKISSLNYKAIRFLVTKGIKTYIGPQHKNISYEVDALREQGFTFLKNLNPKTPELVSEFLARVPSDELQRTDDLDEYFRTREMRGVLRSLPVWASGSPDCVLTKFALQKSLLSIVQEFMGLPTERILCNVAIDALFREKVGHIRTDGYDGAVNFHRDLDAWRWLKVFVYLNDVEEGGGQHEVFLNSHKYFPRKFWKISRYSKNELQEYFPIGFQGIIGPAGTCFAENTLAFHRAAPPVKKSRLILTAVYFDDSVLGIHPELFRLR